MAQNDRALFLYGFDINGFNRYINFKNAFGGPEITATLNMGNYTATEFMAEIKRAMEFIDGLNTYTLTLNRTTSGGLSNRMSITTSGAYLDILFNSGTNAATSPRGLMGFDIIDYTGSTTYTGSTNAGTILVPEFPTYDYLGPDDYITNDGVKNVSASGIKETFVFAQMRFFQGHWKYITNFGGRTQLTEWEDFLKYATRQLKFEYEPSIFEDPTIFFECTLEQTPADGNGMGYKLQQMLQKNLYRFYETGVMKFRLNVS